jgi:hypothetical protein
MLQWNRAQKTKSEPRRVVGRGSTWLGTESDSLL